MFTGSIVNALAIVAGGSLGLILKSGLPERFNKTLMQALGLSVLLIGLQGAMGMKSEDTLLIIFSMIIGGCIGEAINIEQKLEDFGNAVQQRFAKLGGGFSKGFVTASLIYCVGSMAIMGALQGGLEGKHDILFAKSVLDGVLSMVLASTLGIGVLASSIPILIYQGGITLCASFLKPLLIPAVVGQMSVAGGLLIAAIGINILDIIRIKVGNLLPAIFLPLVWYGIQIFYKIWISHA